MSGHSRDGFLDRLVFRRLSGPLTAWLVHTPASPNLVTLLGICCGVSGGLALAVSSPRGGVLASALLVVSAVLDCSDGELARRRHAESRLGHVLDVVGDTLVHVAVFAGIVLALGHAGGLERRTLIALAAGVVGAFAAITWSESTEARRHRVACWENRVLDGLLSPLSTRDWYVFPLAFALGGRLDALIAFAAVGAHVFWVAVVVLVVRVLKRAPA